MNKLCNEISDFLFTPNYLKIIKDYKNMPLHELKEEYFIVKEKLKESLAEYDKLNKLFKKSSCIDKLDIDFKRMQEAEKCKELMARERKLDDYIFKKGGW